jgi:hypothetical protein
MLFLNLELPVFSDTQQPYSLCSIDLLHSAFPSKVRLQLYTLPSPQCIAAFIVSAYQFAFRIPPWFAFLSLDRQSLARFFDVVVLPTSFSSIDWCPVCQKLRFPFLIYRNLQDFFYFLSIFYNPSPFLRLFSSNCQLTPCDHPAIHSNQPIYAWCTCPSLSIAAGDHPILTKLRRFYHRASSARFWLFTLPKISKLMSIIG